MLYTTKHAVLKVVNGHIWLVLNSKLNEPVPTPITQIFLKLAISLLLPSTA